MNNHPNRRPPPQNQPSRNRQNPPNRSRQPQRPPQYPPNRQNMPNTGQNGQYPPRNRNGYNGYNNYNGYNAPYQPQPGADPEYVRRRQELERRQAEARRQAMRDQERRERQRLREERERRRKESLKIFGGRLLVFAVILVILCALTGILFLIFFNHAPDEPDTSGKITYSYGGSETRKVPVEEAIVDDIVYVCFNDVADYLGMMESGTAETMRFILPQSDTVPETAGGDGTEESISFYTDTCNVSINGQLIQLDVPNIIRGTEIWVSSTFLTDYINNLSCQYNERKSKLLISRIVDEENSNEEEEIIVYLPVSFKLKNSDALPPIPEE